jgi:succinyl-diaminopimelate desuccinylase
MSTYHPSSDISADDPTIALARALIAAPSVSPDQSSAQDILKEQLVRSGFTIRQMDFNGSRNFWARKGTAEPLIVLSGHTDVVSPGEMERWTTPPYASEIRDGFLYGRGATDMKGALAAMVTAVDGLFGQRAEELPCSLAFLVTGDEELGGPSAEYCLDVFSKEGLKIDFCIVGEFSSDQRVGDTIKIGRRGSLGGTVTFRGKQGHTGYPQLAENALHRCFEPLAMLCRTQWDTGGEYFQPTSFQITRLSAGVADNIIPGEAAATFNFRYSTESTPASLEQQFRAVLAGFPQLSYEIVWRPQAVPFLTQPGSLIRIVSEAIEERWGAKPKFSTAGGTSDARFFARHGIEVIELGTTNDGAHQVDERTSVTGLIELSALYKTILQKLAKI